MSDSSPLRVERATDLSVAACVEIADGRAVILGDALLAGLRSRRDELLTRLERGDAVYGVTTGMGAASTIRLDATAQAQQQENLMRARSIGSAPWLTPTETRAALVTRLRTLVNGDAGVAAGLCQHLADMLNADALPAIPATRLGAAGEIIPLAHLGAAVIGAGAWLPGHDGTALAPYRLGPKEGVALIEGVPVSTGLAVLLVRETRILGSLIESALAAEFALTGSNVDPLRDTVIRGDDMLSAIAKRVISTSGSEAVASALQAPVSFRVTAPALAHLERAAAALDAAAARALDGVTDSPAFIGTDFIGTAGFDGFELAALLDALRVALVHVAELSAARLHRLLDDRVTGLPRQLSPSPGLHAGMVTVHKRAVGVVHDLVRSSSPASLGAIETSLGQEDAQSFSMAAAAACSAAVEGLRDVLACEVLAVVQARRLGGAVPAPVDSGGSVDPGAAGIWSAADAAVALGTADRPFGVDVEALVALLRCAPGSF